MRVDLVEVYRLGVYMRMSFLDFLHFFVRHEVEVCIARTSMTLTIHNIGSLSAQITGSSSWRVMCVCGVCVCVFDIVLYLSVLVGAPLRFFLAT